MRKISAITAGVCLTSIVMLASCKQQEPSPPPTPSTAPLAAATRPAPPTAGMGELPAGHPPIDGQAPAGLEVPKDDVHAGMQLLPKSGAARNFLEAPPTQFTGLVLTPPADWKAFDPAGGPMGPIAAFLLPAAEGTEGDTEARLTYYPGMKQIPLETNLDRWYGQVQQPDGRPTKEVAKVETIEAGGAKITITDMSGSIAGVAGQRMIAAAIEHPQGPHFLKVTGPEATLASQYDAIMQYLKSAQVQP